jgi:protein-S-isoprenylcysteine O-methyltransferase Ste14
MIYISAWFLLLVYSFVILRYLVPRDYRNRGELSWPIAFLQALLFFLYGGFPTVYLEADWPAVAVSPLIHVVGLILLFSGLAFLFYGMIRLGIARSIGRGSPRLQGSDIYRLSRNPQAIACGIFVIGFFMLWPSWYALGWVFLYVVLIHMMVKSEEEHLRRKYGQDYLEYCKKVPRYLGPLSFRAKNST